MDDTFLRKFLGFTSNSLEIEAQEANLPLLFVYILITAFFLSSISMEIKRLFTVSGISLSISGE